MTTSTRPTRSLATSSKPSARLKTLCLTQDDLVRPAFRNDAILAGIGRDSGRSRELPITRGPTAQ